MTQRDAGRFVVLVTDKIDPAGLAPLAAHPGFELLEKHTPELFEPLLPRAQAWLVRSETKVTAERIAKAPRLRLIGRAGVGVDNIDLAEASRRGIAVVNAPQANTISACEHAWALLLSLARRVPQADREVQAGRWERSKLTGVELMEKTIGLVGLGRIGREMARRAAAFGMRVAAYDPYLSAEQARGSGAELM
ncbi:MAG: NAD(P)-dependent oxidoreductase, partial [Elusimicrobiota bacterium]